MKKLICLSAFVFGIICFASAQEKPNNKMELIPSSVKAALNNKYPESHSYQITWEKEKGNYEANWGGKDGEANSVQFTPNGEFLEIVKAIPSSELPKPVLTYIVTHYKSSKFGDIGKVNDAKGKTSYEVEINGKDVIFDENGNFIKEEK